MNLRQKAPNVPSHWDMPEPPHRTMPGELVSISVNSWLSQNPSKTIPKSVRFHERKSEINDSGQIRTIPKLAIHNQHHHSHLQKRPTHRPDDTMTER
jgi:hypothetical protein